MKDPGRLTGNDTTPFEHRLLAAARSETIPNDLKLRMSQGLDLGAAGLGAGGALAFLSLKKGVLLSVVTVMLAGAAGLVVLRGFTAHAPRTPATPSRVTAPATVPSTSPATVSPTLAPEPVAAPSVPERVVRGGARAPASPAPADRAHESDLRAQIALLDAARAALAARAPAQALGILDRYHRRYPGGTFAPEVLALRIEALVDAGRMGSARSLARQFLNAHPDSPFAERIERLIGGGR